MGNLQCGEGCRSIGSPVDKARSFSRIQIFKFGAAVWPILANGPGVLGPVFSASMLTLPGPLKRAPQQLWICMLFMPRGPQAPRKSAKAMWAWGLPGAARRSPGPNTNQSKKLRNPKVLIKRSRYCKNLQKLKPEN